MTVDIASIIISAVSLLTGVGLSLVAITLSVYFYQKSKESMTSTSNSLTKIDIQVDQLNRINEKLFSKALTSLSQIARQKTDIESSEISVQASAALKAVATIPKQMAAVMMRESQVAKKPDAAEPRNQISGHNLPFLPEPLTLADLRREYFNILVQMLNSIGWVNNYGQQALNLWTELDVNGRPIRDTLNVETAENLNNTAKFYRNSKEFLDQLKTDQPDLFSSNPVTASVLESTIQRLDSLIRDYDETLAEYFPTPSAGT